MCVSLFSPTWQGKTYYYHVITRKSQWTRPTERDADGSVTMDLASSSSSSSSSSDEVKVRTMPSAEESIEGLAEKRRWR